MNIAARALCRAYQLCFRAALPILPYTLPKELDGMGAIPETLAELGVSRALLVIDAGVRALGLTRPLEDALAEANIAFSVYEQRTPNPTIGDVEAALAVYRQADAQAIVAVGGGSAIDCAKVVGARVARPRKSVSQMKGLLRVLRRTPPLVAVPTTAGTGSEATLAAVITDAGARHKYPINDFALIPDYAVLDANLTLGLPPFLTATTGMDALTHAVEAYIGRSTNKLTRAMSEEAVRLIVENLPAAVRDGQNAQAREGMLRAATCAGVAFTRSYVGYVHGVAHALGGQYGVAHGLANAVALPKLLRVYGARCEKKLARLARVAGIAPQEAGDAEAAEAFIAWIEARNAEFGIPTEIAELRAADIPTMARHAARECNPLYPVPMLMDRFELEAVFRLLLPKPAQAAKPDIGDVVAAQRAYFDSGVTRDLSFRRDALARLRRAVLAHEGEIDAALRKDLGKSPTETYMCETGMTLAELSFVSRHMARWARPRRVHTPLAQFLASSFIVQEPKGVALILSPWNYPFMLCMEPLIGALAAGNCCVLKPSAYAPATSALIAKLVGEIFPPEYVAVVEGGRAENQALLDQRFDHIFFTGGVAVGREVMRRASEHLTPVTLELGGKSPCIVDATANLPLAARRLAFGKLLNCGQTCVAPDYVLVDRRVKDELVGLLKKEIERMAGDALQNEDYVHMISQKHFDRVCALIDPEKVAFGGRSDPETLRIEPTVLCGVTGEDAVMQEEIFGPVLPMIEVDGLDEAIRFVNARPRPLALYLFSSDRAVQRRVLRDVRFGGGCINDTIIHLATSRMGFGGVGESGMGSYHGKRSFDTFSHEKSIVNKSTLLDLPVRYMPYTRLRAKLLRLFLR